MWLTDEQLKYLVAGVAVAVVLILLHRCMYRSYERRPRNMYVPNNMNMRRMMMNSTVDNSGRNLNDVETEMRPPVPDRYPVNTTSCRWMSESFVSGKADEEQFEYNPNVVMLPDPMNATDPYDSVVTNINNKAVEMDRILLTRAGELLGADVVTPMKLNLDTVCNSTSMQQLLNTNTDPEFVPNTSATVTI